MFTGLVQEVGTIATTARVGQGVSLTIRAPETAPQVHVGDSISVNGVCLTITELEKQVFRVIAIEETLSKTTLREKSVSSPVNLELAVRLSDRLGGHIVLGHVDCVGSVASVERLTSSWLFKISYPPEFDRYVIPVGSIAIDGVSLTVADLRAGVAAVAIIPHTMEHTIFGTYGVKTNVNIEFDIVGKYVERMLVSKKGQDQGDNLSSDQLRAWGYR